MDRRITIPEGWHEVSIRQFIELSNVNEKGIHHDIECVAILCDEDPEVIKDMDVSDYTEIKNRLTWSMELPKNETKTEIMLNGESLLLIDLKSLTNGEWADLDTFVDDFSNKIHRMVAVLFRKPKEEYNGKVCEERAIRMLDKVMIADVYSAMLFFCLIGEMSMSNIETYLLKKIQENSMNPKEKEKRGWLRRLGRRNGNG